jgi:hypothetical protein
VIGDWMGSHYDVGGRRYDVKNNGDADSRGFWQGRFSPDGKFLSVQSAS